MDIEESSVPYRAFLRSGTYPALSERFVRSGGVLVRAAGWFALVVGAASAGYNTTQRLVTPTAAEPSELPRPRVAQAALAAAAPVAQPAQQLEVVQEIVERDASSVASRFAHASSLGQAAARAAVVPATSKLKRAGAIVQHGAQPAAPSTQEAELEASQTEASRAEQIAERVRALDSAAGAAETSAVSAVVEAVLRDESERPVAEASEKVSEPPPLREARVLAKANVVAPRAHSSARADESAPRSSLPLSAAARIDSLVVRGPLSAAHVRRSVERVRPTLSDCYGDAARQAGKNRFAPVRVQVTIDEAGRVKALPKIDGAQLPGLGACLSAAMSKLVCQAPDTGTAWASITLGFAPERR
jgi:hypothetical protein